MLIRLGSTLLYQDRLCWWPRAAFLVCLELLPQPGSGAVPPADSTPCGFGEEMTTHTCHAEKRTGRCSLETRLCLSNARALLNRKRNGRVPLFASFMMLDMSIHQPTGSTTAGGMMTPKQKQIQYTWSLSIDSTVASVFTSVDKRAACSTQFVSALVENAKWNGEHVASTTGPN